MEQTFSCPSCGAPLDYRGSDPMIRCPYCNASVIVPENLRGKPAFSAAPHNFRMNGAGDLGGLMQQARRFKEIKELAQDNQMDEAVRMYREILPDASDADARAAVQALADGQPITLTNFGSQFSTSSMNMNTFTSHSALSASFEQARDQMEQAQSYSRPTIIDVVPPKKRGNGLGCLLGCGITLLVLGILAATLLPVMGGMFGISSIFKEVGISIPGVDIPGVSGYATQELAFGGEGSGPGLFSDVRALAVAPVSGNIYAANYGDGRVQAFDPQGKFITQWLIKKGVTDPYIQDMAADRQGNVYVVVLGKIMKFDGKGKLLATFEPPNMGHYESIALTASGAIVAVSWGEDIVKLTADGKVKETFPKVVSSVSEDAELGSKVAVDGLGNLYVLGTFNNAVFIYDAEGKYISRFGSAGDEAGQFRAPGALAVDGKGRIFVSDAKGVQVFSNDGRYIDVIKVQYYAYGLAFDDQGNLYVTTNQKKVEKYSIKE